MNWHGMAWVQEQLKDDQLSVSEITARTQTRGYCASVHKSYFGSSDQKTSLMKVAHLLEYCGLCLDDCTCFTKFARNYVVYNISKIENHPPILVYTSLAQAGVGTGSLRRYSLPLEASSVLISQLGNSDFYLDFSVNSSAPSLESLLGASLGLATVVRLRVDSPNYQRCRE
ncbi:hypothetical protein Prudu_000147 [Prunus dulcis]|uniref:Uncharacterized protein n=1 Tax=Prunus dulcis TaxID=3755 RepID=A0A4Y1QKN4_PRUDU|nr:hypothetical protein Prudu_000147 [Prunus dulcis]